MSEIILPPLKRCAKCQQEFPATLDYFKSNSNIPSALHRFCKNCSPGYTQPYSVVYFIQCKINKRVKIGFSEHNFQRRFTDIQNMSPVELELLGVMRGTVKTEQATHSLFQDDFIYGEWYEWSKSLELFIQANCLPLELPADVIPLYRIPIIPLGYSKISL